MPQIRCLQFQNKVRQHCIDVDGISSKCVQTIYNGLDLTSGGKDAGFVERSRRTMVTTVGNIRRVKGHDVFIEAAASVAKDFPDATFSIAGDVLESSYFTELETMVNRSRLIESLSFSGRNSPICKLICTHLTSLCCHPAAKGFLMRLLRRWRHRCRWLQRM